MRLALISPENAVSKNPEFRRVWEVSRYTAFYRRNWTGLSLSLPTIAALTPESWDIEIIDENIDTVDFSRNYDLVGITAMTQQASRAYVIADRFRAGGIPVVIGGIHATMLPEEASLHADSVVIGEAEYTWPELLKDFLQNQLKPFYRSERLVSLQDSPVPRYDLLKGDKYGMVWIQTTRGCPHDCDFCAASKVYGSVYRHKDVAQVVRELQSIRSNMGNIQIAFADDNLFVDRRYYMPLIEEISRLNIRWAGQSDIAVAEHPELLASLRRSGCSFLVSGLESLSADNLKTIDTRGWKMKKSLKYAQYIHTIQSYGIGLMGAFIFGLDYDDAGVFERTSGFVTENNLYYSHFSVLTPFPGTRVRKKIIEENRLLSSNWEQYNLWDVNYVPRGMTTGELRNGIYSAYAGLHNEDSFVRRTNHFKKINLELMNQNAF